MYVRLERLGWTVHVMTPQAAKALLTSSKTFPKVTDTDFAGTLAGKFLAGPNVMSLSGQRWKDHRLIINPAFHSILPIQLFGKKTSKLFSVLDSKYENQKHKPFTIDVDDILFRWSLDVLGEGILGIDFQGLEGDESNPWTIIYKQFDHDVKNPLFVILPQLDQQFRWLFPKRQAAHDNLTKFHSMIYEVICNKRKLLKKQQERGILSASSLFKHQGQNGDEEGEDKSKKDLLTLMLESEFSKKLTPLTDEELINNVCVFFAAGHDTTKSTVAFALYYLSKYPKIQEKARKEAIEVLCANNQDNDEDILPTRRQLKQLKYINQIIKEVLRLQGSVVSFVTPRIATEDTQIVNQFIPKNTMVSLNIYDLHRNENVWSNSEAFDPDRFSSNGEWENQPHNNFTWIAFGGGERKCIGFKFNIAEQLVLLTMLLRKYEFSLPDGSIHHDHPITNNIVVMNPIDMRITFKKRY
ncbi:cytochrome P450 [Cunninghamella echinulata]|nr:cytochrome P450 [Cunninghamella echinulata]